MVIVELKTVFSGLDPKVERQALTEDVYLAVGRRKRKQTEKLA